MRVGDLGDVRMGKQLSPLATSHSEQSPYLRVANVFEGRIDYGDVKSMHFSPAEREVFGLKPGDILLNEGQSIDLVGRSAIFDGQPGHYCFQNTLVRYRVSQDLDPYFAQLVFTTWRRTGAFARIARQTTSIGHLGADRFANMHFPWIPLSAQQRIVAQLGVINSGIQAAKQEVAKLENVKHALLDTLLPQPLSMHSIMEPAIIEA